MNHRREEKLRELRHRAERAEQRADQEQATARVLAAMVVELVNITAANVLHQIELVARERRWPV